MPGDGLSLAIQIGCEVDGIAFCGSRLELPYNLILAGEDPVVGLPAVVRIYAHAAHEVAVLPLLPEPGLLIR